MLVLAALPVGAVLFIVAVLSPSLITSLLAIGAFSMLNNGAASSSAIIIATLGSSRSRGKLAATHIFLQMIFGGTIGPVGVALLSDHVFKGNLGPSMITMLIVSAPIALMFYYRSRKVYAVEAEARLRTHEPTGR